MKYMILNGLLKILVLVKEETKTLFGDLYSISMYLSKVIGTGNSEPILEEDMLSMPTEFSTLLELMITGGLETGIVEMFSLNTFI